MKSNQLYRPGRLVAAISLILAGSLTIFSAIAWPQALAPSRPTTQEEILYNFDLTGLSGRYSVAGLVRDAEGNLYGTTSQGGKGKAGTVFKLSPQSGGNWTVKLLHDFSEDDAKGSQPVAGVILDAAGNLYGTTQAGGAVTGACYPGGCGTVFELSPQAGGGWSEKVLYSFLGKPDGNLPTSSLAFDSAGNLYGTTQEGGDYTLGECDSVGCGTVFELSSQSEGGWTEKVLYNFQGNPDGSSPRAGLVLDAAGNLYGTTFGGGNATCYLGDCGTVFELVRKPGNSWIEKLRYSFRGQPDGYAPAAGLIFDAAGNLYGSTAGGGASTSTCLFTGCGTVFELMPKSGLIWAEEILYTFLGPQSDGDGPSGIVFDPTGNLYGTTYGGGSRALGTVFELSPQSGGIWSETLLHSFRGFHTDGRNPYAGVILDPAGNLYGTTGYGGNGTCISGCGTVFKVTP